MNPSIWRQISLFTSFVTENFTLRNTYNIITQIKFKNNEKTPVFKNVSELHSVNHFTH